MSKKIRFDNQVLAHMKKGIDELANAVKVTLGPAGRNVALEKAFGSPTITKDGVSVAREIELEGLGNQAAQAVKQAAIRTSEIAGDGTTTVTVLSQAIFGESYPLIASGSHPIFLSKGIRSAMVEGLDFLKEMVTPVSGLDDVRKVATQSSNGDKALGDLIAEAVQMVGKDGVITVEESPSIETYLEFSEGLQLDRGYSSRDFLVDPESVEINLVKPYVLLVNHNINTLAEILPTLEFVAKEKRPLLIVAHDVVGEALSTLIFNHRKRIIDVCVVKAPRIGDKRTEILDNLGVLTGASVVSKLTGTAMTNDPSTFVGSASSVTITKEDTTILGGAGDDTVVEMKIHELKTKLRGSGSEHDKEFYQQQISQMAGGVAIIRVGAATELELKEYKARVEDALSATRAAVTSGILPGGGSTMLEMSYYLKYLMEQKKEEGSFSCFEEEQGWKILVTALQAPFKQILTNAGKSADIELYKFRLAWEQSDRNLVYDVVSDQIVDGIEAGIIDPAQVVEEAIKNAVSVSSTLITAACSISSLSEDELFSEEDGYLV